VSAEAGRRRRGRPPGAWGSTTRRRILHGARGVFSEAGFDSASMEHIAREAGISRPALANYFDSKAAIYKACFDEVQEDALTLIMSEAPDPSRPAVERIIGLFEAAIRYGDQDYTQVRFWVTSTLDLARHSSLDYRPDHQFVTLRRYFTECVESGIERGELAPEVSPPHTAQLLINMLVGIAVDIGFYATPERVAGVLESIRRMVSGTLLTGPAATPG
jgi:AcrR family transcriptional regulator